MSEQTAVDDTPDEQAGADAAGPTPRPGRWWRPRGVTGFILRRILLGLVTLIVASIAIFALTQALPGDPARARLGKDATPESLAALRQQLGLDRSALAQYADWAGGLLHGDLGTSLISGHPITDDLRDRAINSLTLVLVSALIAIPLSIVLGAYAALRRDRLFDTSSGLVLLILAALPEFVIGLALVALFATTVLQVLPAVSLIPPGGSPLADPALLVLPTVTLVLAIVPYVARIMRASMVEVLESEYVEMARLKGMPERLVVWRHALPNSIGPTFQVIALSLAYLAGGVIVVESVFNYPGIGLALRDAVLNRDFTTVQAIAMLIAVIYVVTNLVADIATILVTPRLRTSLT
jgi:peptide/nickel transport system permease protein